jgi:putative DNA primase/helicase
MANKIKPRGENPLIQITGAGKDRFDEHQIYQSLMLKIPPIMVYEDDWFEYDGKAWRPSRRKQYVSTVYDILPLAHRSARLASNVLNAVEAARQVKNEKLRGAIIFDDDGRVLVNVNNGVLRVSPEGVELLPHDPSYLFTGCLPSNYHSSAESPIFEDALNATLHNVKDKSLLQWFAGYCLFPDCKQHEVFLICYGPGGTGKSTLAEAIVSAFDDDVLVRKLSLSQICSSGPGSYSLPTLERAMVNLGTELDTVEVDESGTFKQLISGESIVARSIYGKPFTMNSTCKHLFLSNVMPRFKHGTDAELRRARFLAFGKKPEAIDRTLKDKLVAQKDYILYWAVEGLRAILEGVSAPYGGEESNNAIRRFQLSNDPVQCFVSENLDLDPDAETSKDDVMEAFSQFLDAHQFAHRTREYFFRALYERNPQIRVVKYYNKAPMYWLRGVRLRQS